MERHPPPAHRFARILIGVFFTASMLLLVRHPAMAEEAGSGSEAPHRAAHPSDPTHIGILLPLTGKFAVPGQEVKKGLELALKQLPETAAGPLTLFYKDTQDDPELTTKAVHELVEKDRVVAIVGPLVSATVDAAANAAAELEVPLLALTQKSEVPHLGEYVFRDFMTSDAQMRSLAGYAVDTLGLKRFAIVYPEQRYGMELAGLFWDEVVRRGGKVVGVESYPVGTTDFLNVARRVGGKYYQELRRKEFFKGENEYLKAYKEAGKKPPRPYELPPIVDFDALFLPDQFRPASLLASTLAYMDVPIGAFTVSKDQTPVRVLGSSAWNSPDLPSTGGDYLENCVFVDNFFALSPDPDVKELVSSFQKQYGKAPDLLAATGYDALGLLASLLKDRGTDRAGLRQRIVDLKGYTGATGTIAFDAHGELKKELFVLGVHKKQLVQISPALPEKTP